MVGAVLVSLIVLFLTMIVACILRARNVSLPLAAAYEARADEERQSREKLACGGPTFKTRTLATVEAVQSRPLVVPVSEKAEEANLDSKRDTKRESSMSFDEALPAYEPNSAFVAPNDDKKRRSIV
jgi:hypothetical protein